MSAENLTESEQDCAEVAVVAAAPVKSNRAMIAAILGILLLLALAYENSFSVPYLFDDYGSIRDNQSIQHWSTAFSPPTGHTVAGRPFLNLSFAVNYALGKDSLWGYRATNLALHALAAIALCAIVRRTLLLRGLRDRFGRHALGLGFAVACLWALHPLQTETVTYLAQRAESLVGLCYVATLYFFIRGATGSTPAVWFTMAVTLCIAGMATNEVMVSAPILVLLYDRVFLAGNFRDAWRLRKGFYLALAATWGVLAILGIRAGWNHGIDAIGVASGASWSSYVLTQFKSLVTYARLGVWPARLSIDYGDQQAKTLSDWLPSALVVLALGVATVAVWWRRPKLGYIGICSFLLLAPTSLVPWTTQLTVEHRAYLALAPLLMALVLAVWTIFGRAGWIICLVAALSFGALTHQRNDVYRSELSLWEDAVRKEPENLRAHYALGTVLLAVPNRSAEAIAQFEWVLVKKPDWVEAHVTLGNIFLRTNGKYKEAIAHYQEAVRLRPGSPEIRMNLANAYSMRFRRVEAEANYREAIRLDPKFSEAYFGLANILALDPKTWDEAERDYREATKLRPDNIEYRFNLGVLLGIAPGRAEDAMTLYREIVQIRPDHVPSHYNLGLLLSKTPGKMPEAIAELSTVLKIDPENLRANYMLDKIQNMMRPGSLVPSAIKKEK